MRLAKHLTQGRLVYLSQQQDAISVSENDYYRWMAFNDVVQSVMNKRKPWQLTLPHQIALMLPLLFFKPCNIVEFGLGGGNFARFLRHLSADISIKTIEYNQVVIDCFNQYFNPDNGQYQLIYADSIAWLNEHNSNEFDWLICDVYQAKHLGFEHMVKQLELLTANASPQSCLSINLPDIRDSDINLCLTILQQLMPFHHINYFTIPNYLNIVIHLTPCHWQLHKLLKRNKLSYLPATILQRWRKFWPHRQQLT
ncbi:hypothetical protein AADZ84_12440 [Colwelliaceae bacterium MEBiC 14330]